MHPQIATNLMTHLNSSDRRLRGMRSRSLGINNLPRGSSRDNSMFIETSTYPTLASV